MKKLITLLLIILLLGSGFYVVNRYQNRNDIENYEKMVTAIADGYENFDEKVNLFKYNIDDVTLLEKAMSEVNNQIYYSNKNYKYHISKIGINDVLLEYNYYNGDMIDIVKCRQVQAETDNAITEFIASIDTSKSQYEQILEVHDKLIDLIDYDLSDSPSLDSYSIYGALVNNKAVCDGYSYTLIKILRELGISASYVGSEAMNHSWVMVQYNNSNYYIDITWDDPIALYGDMYVSNSISHQYFMITEDELSKDHYDWTVE